MNNNPYQSRIEALAQTVLSDIELRQLIHDVTHGTDSEELLEVYTFLKDDSTLLLDYMDQWYEVSGACYREILRRMTQ